MRAGAVAKVGMAPTTGAMKMAARKSRPVVMAVTPVRPPAATPSASAMAGQAKAIRKNGTG